MPGKTKEVILERDRLIQPSKAGKLAAADGWAYEDTAYKQLYKIQNVTYTKIYIKLQKKFTRYLYANVFNIYLYK